MSKNIVFDLDYTLGFFSQMVYILNSIEAIKKLDLESYAEVFELFPECFRPGLTDLLIYVLNMRREGRVHSIILYTNNNNDYFVEQILSYLNKQVSQVTSKLFDCVITSHHPNRTSKDKSLNELVCCSDGLITHDSKICFIDDKKYLGMIKEQVYYIRCEKYKYYIPSQTVSARLKMDIPRYKNKEPVLTLNSHRLLTEQLLGRIRHFILT